MHCLLHPELNRKCLEYSFSGDDIKHIRALRLKANEKIMLTNGFGLSLIANIKEIKTDFLVLENPDFIENFGELGHRVAVALAILDNRERMEFALEKSVELGASDFYPLISRNCQREKINTERLEAKAIASLKQCYRSRLIKIHKPLNINDIEEVFKDYDRIFLTDRYGIEYQQGFKRNSNLILIGPEGGFTSEEINFIKKNPKTIAVNLGNRRLRAETVVISMMTLLSLNSE